MNWRDCAAAICRLLHFGFIPNIRPSLLLFEISLFSFVSTWKKKNKKKKESSLWAVAWNHFDSSPTVHFVRFNVLNKKKLRIYSTSFVAAILWKKKTENNSNNPKSLCVCVVCVCVGLRVSAGEMSTVFRSRLVWNVCTLSHPILVSLFFSI